MACTSRGTKHIRINKRLVGAITDHEAQRGGRGVTTFSLTSALDRGGWLTQRPGRFNLGKETPYPLYTRLGGAPWPVWTGAENLAPPPGFDPRTVKPVASRCAIPAHVKKGRSYKTE
jgi:hypothetical protein